MLRLVTYTASTQFNGIETRLGTLLDNGDVLDLRASYEADLREKGDPHAAAIAAARIPATMIDFIKGGEHSIAAADAAFAAKHPVVLTALEIELLPPLIPGKLVCMGRNYWEHAAESTMPVPDDFPRGFIKVQSTLTGPFADIPYPWPTKEFDFESELVVIIGKPASHVSKADAWDYIYGYTVMNDLSGRDWQFAERKKGNHLLGKNLDATGPMGPAIILRRDLPDVNDLRVTTRINGETRQDSRTTRMIHDIPTQVAHWSRMTLEPGDIISTGTPEGVGSGNGGSDFLQVGDVLESEVENVGLLRNTIVAPAREAQGFNI